MVRNAQINVNHRRHFATWILAFAAAQLIFFFAPAPAQAAILTRCVVLNWQPATQDAEGGELSDLAGYRVYMSQAPGLYEEPFKPTESPTLQVCDLIVGQTYYFRVTAVDTSDNESAPSDESSILINRQSPENGQASGSELDFTGSGLSSILTRENISSSSLSSIRFRVYSLTGELIKEEITGSSADMSAPGDYDGDGITDIGVVGAAGHRLVWKYRGSKWGQEVQVRFGQSGDIALAGCRFDADGITDRAIVRPGIVPVIHALLSSKGHHAKRLRNFPRNISALGCSDLNSDGVDEILVVGRRIPNRNAASTVLAGYDIASGALVFNRPAAPGSKLVLGDSDQDFTVEPGLALREQDGQTLVTLFRDGLPTETSLSIGNAAEFSPGKFELSSGARFDGFAVVERASRQILLLPLAGAARGGLSLTLPAAEHLVGAQNFRIRRRQN